MAFFRAMTTPSIQFPPVDASRGEVARSLVEILRAYSRINFNSFAVGDTIEQSLIVSAIIIGQAEGRLMTASDISNYLGMPRPTVVRKLLKVAAARDLRTMRCGNRVCYFLSDANDDRVLTALVPIMKSVKRLAAQLSKLDTGAIDQAHVSR
jgi:hypothetical protein